MELLLQLERDCGLLLIMLVATAIVRVVRGGLAELEQAGEQITAGVLRGVHLLLLLVEQVV